MARIDTRIATFEAARSSGRAARRFVADVLRRWGRDGLVEDAVLCTAELAANAVLHARSGFELAVRPAGDGVRVEVIDARPSELPVPVPRNGMAGSLTAESATGRGLYIIAALADRWGCVTSPTAKSVWAELSSGPRPAAPSEPVMMLGHEEPSTRGEVQIRLLGLSTRLAIASGIQLDEVIRVVQLGMLGDVVEQAERDRLFDLVDRSAHDRLSGRHAAFRAAARRHVRFDLDLATDLDALTAVAELARTLSRLPLRAPSLAPVPSPEVQEFRAWLGREVNAQLRGSDPTPAP